MKYFRTTKIEILVALFALLSPLHFLNAATLYLDAPGDEFGSGDQFGVDVRLELGEHEECINTVEAAINFDGTYLEAVDFSVGESILSLWIDRPTTNSFDKINIDQRLSFTGGVPGGYCGKIPGDQGVSNSIGKIIFRAKGGDKQLINMPVTKITFDKAVKVLQNNGLGSEAKVEIKDLSLVIKPKLVKQKTEWSEIKSTDYLAPEHFEIQLLKDANLFDGQYYLMFNTVDKQSGIDHYEVSEQRAISSVYQKIADGLLSVLPGYEVKQANWQTVNVPYVVRDQSLKSIIRVKAIDKAGNQTVIERKADTFMSLTEIVVAITLFVLLLFVAAVFVLRLHKRFKSKVITK